MRPSESLAMPRHEALGRLKYVGICWNDIVEVEVTL